MVNKVIREQRFPHDRCLQLVQGDITNEQVDAIVNAANSHLQHGGGVAGAIVRRGGDEIQWESDEIGYVAVGEAALTGAGRLPCGHIIHAVGPQWGEGDEPQKLKGAVLSSLRLADEKGFQSISMPAISSGIFGFPKEQCAHILITTIRDYLQTDDKISLKQVRICLFDVHTVSAFLDAWRDENGDG